MARKQLPAKSSLATTQDYPLEIINLLDVLARIEARRKKSISHKEAV